MLRVTYSLTEQHTIGIMKARLVGSDTHFQNLEQNLSWSKAYGPGAILGMWIRRTLNPSLNHCRTDNV